jgi:hypothetical protein
MTMSLRLLSQFKILFRKKDFSDNTNWDRSVRTAARYSNE